jgi:hypothetical protein
VAVQLVCFSGPEVEILATDGRPCAPGAAVVDILPDIILVISARTFSISGKEVGARI